MHFPCDAYAQFWPLQILACLKLWGSSGHAMSRRHGSWMGFCSPGTKSGCDTSQLRVSGKLQISKVSVTSKDPLSSNVGLNGWISMGRIPEHGRECTLITQCTLPHVECETQHTFKGQTLPLSTGGVASSCISSFLTLCFSSSASPCPVSLRLFYASSSLCPLSGLGPQTCLISYLTVTRLHKTEAFHTYQVD